MGEATSGDSRVPVPFVRRGLGAIAVAAGVFFASLGCAGFTGSEAPTPVSEVAAGPQPAVPPAPDVAPAGVAPPADAAAAADPPWIADAVAEALDWEVMPGTTEDPDDGTRAAELRTFFLAHPEYADASRRTALSADGCAVGTEAAHTRDSFTPAFHAPAPCPHPLHRAARAGSAHQRGCCACWPRRRSNRPLPRPNSGRRRTQPARLVR